MIWTSAEASWDWSLTWNIVAAVVGILTLVGVIYAVIGYYRDHPKRSIEYTVRVRQLVQAVPMGMLEIKAGDTVFTNPYFCELQLVSNSRADIPSSAFDAGRLLSFGVRSEEVVLLEQKSTGGLTISKSSKNQVGPTVLAIKPQLIRKRASAVVTLLSNGKPSLTISSPLIDIPITNVTDRPAKVNLFLAWFYLVMGLVLVGTFIFALIDPPEDNSLWSVAIAGLMGTTMTGFAMFMMRSQTRWRRQPK